MKKIFNQIAALSLAVSIAFSITACGTSGSSDSKQIDTFAEDEAISGDRLQADWIDNAIIYEVNVRQYTEEGTFEAFGKHLERLKAMGVNTLWFMPIYSISQVNKKGTLGSYYSISDYMSVNSEFGTKEDFETLVNTAHEMGFHVILDWVANHTGWDHVWISEHPEYYLKDETGEITCPLGTDWVDVAQLDYSNKDMRKAMIDAMSYWIKDIGIDGFRCDYAQGVPMDFWEEARTALDEIKPIYMVAEDGSNSVYLMEKAFDSDYNFELYDAIKFSAKMSNSADDMKKFINPELPYGASKMNFLDNHDKNTYNDTMSTRFGSEALGALHTIVFTAEGIPLIYSGNEEDDNISLEFFEKDNIDFGDYKYEELLTKLCKIKTDNEPLYSGIAGGKVRFIDTDNDNVLCYERVKNGKKITTIVNCNAKEQNVKYDRTVDAGTILLHGDSTGIDENENQSLDTSNITTLNPWEYYIVYSEK